MAWNIIVLGMRITKKIVETTQTLTDIRTQTTIMVTNNTFTKYVTKE